MPKLHPSLPKFILTFLKTTKLKHDLNSLSFWVPFLQNKGTYSDFAIVCTYFARMSSHFARILGDFARIFTNSKLWGCCCQWWSLETWSWSRVVSWDPFLQVSVSNVSGLVSVSKDFGLGLELLVSRLCMSYFLWSLARRSSLKKHLYSNCSKFSRSKRSVAKFSLLTCYYGETGADPGGPLGRSPPLKPTKVTLFTMIL